MEFREGPYRALIQSTALDRPLGDAHYFAKVANMVREHHTDIEQIDAAQFGETWGATEIEAEAKMAQRVRKWISANL